MLCAKLSLGSNKEFKQLPKAIRVGYRQLWLAVCSWEGKEKTGRGSAPEPVMHLQLVVAGLPLKN